MKETYWKGIVTFLDVLGFRDLVATADAGTVDKKLNAVERFTGFQDAFDEELEKEFGPRVFQFSDSILRVRRVDTEKNIKYPSGHLFHEILDLVYAQADLIREGVLIRGGVSYGDVLVSEARVFGPAVISAYETESKYALYPRIVIAPEVLIELKKNPLLGSHNTLEYECEEVRKLLCRGDDGLWFIDYVRAIESELDEPDMYPIFLRTHKDLIIEGARRFKSMTAAMGKFIWLAMYHNSVVETICKPWFKKYGISKAKLSISSRELPLLTKVEP